MTDAAADAVRELIGSERSDRGGARVTVPESGSTTAVQVSVVSEPSADDVVVEHDGVQVYLPSASADALADKTLDVTQDGEFLITAGQEEMLNAEIAVAEGKGTPEQMEQVQSDAQRRIDYERRRAWDNDEHPDHRARRSVDPDNPDPH